MYASSKLVDKLEGVENFCSWKYRIALILEENDLSNFIKEDVLEPDEATTKSTRRTWLGPKGSLQTPLKIT